MIKKKMYAALEKEGWHLGRDEVGDRYGTVCLGVIILQILPALKKCSDHYRLSLMPSVSTLEFRLAEGKIFGGKSSFAPIISSNLLPEKIPDPNENDVARLSNEAIEWARSQDIEAGIDRYIGLGTDCKGAMPLRHLAALSIRGDVERLRFYETRFEKGDRLGFVPYITQEMLGRAIAIARKNIV